MPLYDYDCLACAHRFEAMHGVHVDGPNACPTCGSDRVRKAFTAPAVHFKGSGWAKKERRATAAPSRSVQDDGEGPGGEKPVTGGDTKDGSTKDGSTKAGTSSPERVKGASGASDGGSGSGSGSVNGSGSGTGPTPAATGASAD